MSADLALLWRMGRSYAHATSHLPVGELGRRYRKPRLAYRAGSPARLRGRVGPEGAGLFVTWTQAACFSAALALGMTACCPPTVTQRPPRIPASTTERSAPAPRADVSPLYRDHPLVNRIYDVRQQRFISSAALIAALRERPLLLGEKHDNVDHHRLQGWVVAQRFAEVPCSAAIFEMLDDNQQPALDAFLRSPQAQRDADTLSAMVQWSRSGWPEFTLYAPVFQAVLDHCQTLRPGSFPKERSMDFAHLFADALPPGFAARAALEAELPQAQQQQLRQEMRASHCNMLPDSMLDGMVFIQRVRDARLATSILRQDYPNVIVIAGNGHVRRDRGVPRYMKSISGWDSAVVSFQEVVQGAATIAAHIEASGEASLPYDYVWFTAGSDDGDPCEQFKQKKMPPAATGDDGSTHRDQSAPD